MSGEAITVECCGCGKAGAAGDGSNANWAVLPEGWSLDIAAPDPAKPGRLEALPICPKCQAPALTPTEDHS